MKLLALCLVASFAAAPLARAQKLARKESPFAALRWNEGVPEVEVDSVWYRAVSIQGVTVNDILAFCEERWPGDRERRFGEDLVEAMVLMGHTPPAEVELVLVRLADDESVTLMGVTMSAENRTRIRDASRVRPVAPPREPVVLSREEALEDIDAFGAGLSDQFAYLHMRGIDLDAELGLLRTALSEEVRAGVLADQLNQLLLRFGDGHAGVSSADTPDLSAFPPALFVPAAGGVVALSPDRSRFLDAGRPYVATIDGDSLAVWLAALRPYAVDGSPQLVRHRSLAALRELQNLRRVRGRERTDTVTFGLVSRPGDDDVRELELELVPRPASHGPWPRRETGLISEGTIGYLRLERMSGRLMPRLRSAMASFRDTRGLVVDVRGNGGGSRRLLVEFAGYLLGPNEEPWVGNVAAYRLSDRFQVDHLETRYMRRASDERWTPAQRVAIQSCADTFEPEWSLPEGFSEWHYLVLDRTGAPGEYFYDKPVVVLADAGCFSATDIFLGALEGRPRVTLMGSASGGGSARSRGFELPHGGIHVQCASMASFRPDGRLYDGRGVEVDVPVAALPTDLLVGGTDSCLDAAIALLQGR